LVLVVRLTDLRRGPWTKKEERDYTNSQKELRIKNSIGKYHHITLISLIKTHRNFDLGLIGWDQVLFHIPFSS
jgi:hypothetical protein